MTKANKRHAAAVKAAVEETIAMDVIKELSREEDLETVMLLIKFHDFGPTDLFNVKKTKRKPKTGGNAVKKTPATPRKATAAKRVKIKQSL
jgi:hypothetical protein